MRPEQPFDLSSRLAPGSHATSPSKGAPIPWVLHATGSSVEEELRQLLYNLRLTPGGEAGQWLTLPELRRIDKTIWPLVAIGTAESSDSLFRRLRSETNPVKRREVYGPGADAIHAWVARRTIRAWKHFGFPGQLPPWHCQAAEWICQMAVRPEDIWSPEGLPAPDDFLPWETKRVRP